jgi:mono/diheme cytochrome c family protein
MRHEVVTRPLGRVLVAALLCAATLVHAAEPRGAALYRRHCAGCHGDEGRGDGPDAELLAEPPRDLRDGVLRQHDTAALVRRIRDGRPLALTRDRRALDRWLADTDALVDHVERLARSDRSVTDDGRRLWAVRCERCHGRFGTPPPDVPNEAPDDLADPAVQRRFDDRELRDAARHGVPGMPALDPPVSAQDARLLAAYVRLLSPGLALYARVCASCHGEDGRPVDLPPGLRRPVVTFDATWLAGTTRAERETAVWHMLADERPRMPHLAAALGERDAAAIVEWLRAQAR